MSAYRNINTSFWGDPKVKDEFTPEDKYFYIYLLTNPHTNICGCYEISYKDLEIETGYSRESITRLIDRMCNVHKVIKFDPDTKEILVLKWGRYNWSRSEKLVSAVKRVAVYIKNDEFKLYVFDRLQEVVTETSYTVKKNYKCMQRNNDYDNLSKDLVRASGV